MATNTVHELGTNLEVVQAGRVSGDPMVIGQLPGVAETSSEATTNRLVMQTVGIYQLLVNSVDAGGNSAVAVGDILYYVTADTPKLNKKNTGVRFGYALETVTSGAQGTIKVKVGF
jgi:predicted RecA/RadA family phage recombinase